ncbi:MAG: lamin tail domain-containing protein [Bacteroidota bacterium]
MKTGFLLLLLFFTANSWSQLTDDFSDGNFTTNPVWSGTNADFIVNAGQELQINNTIAATSYLSTPHGLSTLDGQEWRIWVKQSFSPSSSNFGRIYLTSSAADLTTNPDGFYLQLGEAGSLDAIRLFKSVSGVSTEICAGTSAQIANSFTVGIRVVRSNAGLWSLYVDAVGGINYAFQSSGTDATNLLGTHFGVLGTYTVSNSNKFFFDNVYAGPEIFDTQAPAIVSSTVISATQIDVLFSEVVSGAAATTAGNYTLNPSVAVQTAAIDGGNGALVHLTLSGNLQNGQTYQVTVASIDDLAGNTATNLTTNCTFLIGEIASAGDVIITEFMADPTPAIGLPELEFIEIHNVSTKIFDLTDWKIGDASADGTITAGWILPGEYKILCATSSLPSFPGGFAVTSFPSLNNAGDDVVLKDTGLVIIDKVIYTDDWYNDPIKQEGGYTLELINPNDPCSDQANWTGSNWLAGGTPGAQNSVYDITPDTQAPSLVLANALAPNQVELYFSEGMDSTSVANSVMTVNPLLTVNNYSILDPFPTSVTITFNENLMASQLYTFTIGTVGDCWLNTTTLSGQFALADLPVAGDLVINEILFDPGTGGTDFVELFNNSSKVLNLKDYSLANFDNDTIDNSQPITGNYLLFPGEYVVLTADSSFQKDQFPAAIPGTFYQMSIPALNNDSSTIYLIYDSVVLDKVSYLADWHLSLIDETENKTLERIDPAGLSNLKGNWHTAAEPIGFGTPGGQNSQYQAGGVTGDFGTVLPIFSPDNDGLEDVIQFFYTMPQPGMIATIRIFDDQGRLIREVVKSELLGLTGNLTWDGVNDNNTKAGLGVYLAVMEAFSVDGVTKFAKRAAFTLAGRLD